MEDAYIASLMYGLADIAKKVGDSQLNSITSERSNKDTLSTYYRFTDIFNIMTVSKISNYHVISDSVVFKIQFTA